MLTLRPYQHTLIAQTRAAMQAGARRVLVTSPTGSGKTSLIAHLLASVAANGKRAWFCCHRRELIDQSVRTFVESADIHVGIVAAGYPHHPLAPVQVCSVPSLAKRAHHQALPDLIVWDECHHLASTSWAALAAQFPHALQIGLTATPQRLDGRGLGSHFDTIIQGPTTAELTVQGYLSPYKFYAPGAVSMAGVHRVAGDYNKKEAADVMARSTVVGDCVSHYLAHCAGARALVFGWSLEASRGIADAFTLAGIRARHVDGETPRSDRHAAMRSFRDGDVSVLCNVDLFGEGLDVPAVDAVFLLRPTASLGLYLQQVGRGLRVSAGKQFVRIFDHVNNWQRHGLPDDSRTWTLEGRTSRTRESEPQVKRCAACFGVSRAGVRVCPLCGVVFPVNARTVARVEGTLVETDVDVLRQLGLAGVGAPIVPRPKTIDEWKALGAAKGYNPKWAYVQWSMRKRA